MVRSQRTPWGAKGRAERALAACVALLWAVLGFGAQGGMLVGGQQLAAASCGVRNTLWIEHYKVVLYLPEDGGAAEVLGDPRRPKALRMQIINRMLMPAEIPAKWRTPMKATLDPAEFARAESMYQALQPGDRLTLIYGPETGVVVQVNGRASANAPGHRLIDALLETWADGDPLEHKLDRVIARNPCAADTLAGGSMRFGGRG